jgi:hypothetical protein
MPTLTPSRRNSPIDDRNSCHTGGQLGFALFRVLTLRLALAAVLLLALFAWILVPDGIHAGRLLAAGEDPVRLADLALNDRFSAASAGAEIEAALAARDFELARSFVELADERGLPLDSVLRQRVAEQEALAKGFVPGAGRFVHGLLSGEPDDAMSLAGTVTGDLFVFGDVRDVLRETGRMARGEAVDGLVLGLASAGLAITAGTYATAGAASPARVGLSVAKVANKTGRIGARMSAALARPLHEIVDRAALKQAFDAGALLQPAVAVRAARAAVKIEKAQELVRFAGDLGRVQAKAGARAALDGLKVAEHPRDVTRLARLAEAKGGKTRAIVKVLGRGAIALTYGAFQIASWIFWALLNVVALCATLKALAESATMRVIRHRKFVRARASSLSSLMR